MATSDEKPTVGDTVDEIHAGINTVKEEAAEDFDAVSDRLQELEQQLRQAGDHLLENAKVLTNAASRQMQTHPLAAFGVAFLAGITVARVMRR